MTIKETTTNPVTMKITVEGLQPTKAEIETM
jgi:hypothetical protein